MKRRAIVEIIDTDGTVECNLNIMAGQFSVAEVIGMLHFAIEDITHKAKNPINTMSGWKPRSIP